MSFATGWKRTVKIKDLLDDDGSTENVRRVAGLVYARLSLLRDYEEDGLDEFSSVVDEIAGIAHSTDEDYSLDWTPLAHFNACLGCIYDWAYEERVWIS